jgi:hypothetical protein
MLDEQALTTGLLVKKALALEDVGDLLPRSLRSGKLKKRQRPLLKHRRIVANVDGFLNLDAEVKLRH